MARRAWGEGSYIHVVPVSCRACSERDTCAKRGDRSVHCSKRDRKERWLYQYRVMGVDGKYKRKALSATTRKELVRKVDEMRALSAAGEHEDITISGWTAVWLAQYMPHTVRPATEMFYSSLLKHIPDKIGSKKLADVTTVQWQEFLNSLLMDKGLSTKTVRSIRTTLISCMESAVDNGFAKKNTAKKTKPPVLKQKKIIFLSQEEAERLQHVADTGEYYTDLMTAWQNIGTRYLITGFGVLIRLALATGMRRGELLGLTWQDVDMDAKSVHVINNLQRGVLSETKTAHSVRYVSLDDDTVTRLRNWREYQSRYAEDVGDLFSNNENLVFTNTFGHPINADTFRSRYFNKMCKTAQLPEGTTLHSLRHTHTTLLLAAGVSPRVISDRLGHASVAFTLQTYAHATTEMNRGAAKIIGKILGKKK